MVKWLLNFDCAIKGIWRTLSATFKSGYIHNVGGCNFVEEETINNASVVVSKCNHCGKYDVSWERKQ